MLSESAQRKLEEIVSLNMKATFGDAAAFAARLELTKSMDGMPVEVPSFVEERVGLLEWTASDGSMCFTMFPREVISERPAAREAKLDVDARGAAVRDATVRGAAGCAVLCRDVDARGAAVQDGGFGAAAYGATISNVEIGLSMAFLADKHVLFWHGGGLVTEIGLPHWEFCVTLVEALGCAVTMPAYPLLPLHDWKRAHACLEAVYADLLAKMGGEGQGDPQGNAQDDPQDDRKDGHRGNAQDDRQDGHRAGSQYRSQDSPQDDIQSDPHDDPRGDLSSRIVFMGDSAGGLLAISLAQLCVLRGWPTPRALITFSPMTDLSNEVDFAEKAALEADDPLIGFAGLGQVPALWIPDEADRSVFPPCPLLGPMADLPPQWLFAGSREALLPEMLEYARRVEEAGSRIVVNVREGLWHDYPLMLDMDEGCQAFSQVLNIVRTL